MPSNFLYVDTNFPTFTGEESVNEKITTIQNYMYMLVEQLRYSLHNLDLSNMNKTAVQRYETNLTEPIYARIESEDEKIVQLALTAEGLKVQIEAADGRITALQQTVDGFSLTATNGETSSRLSLTSNGVVISSASISFSGMVTFSSLSGSGKSVINGDNITTGTIRALTMEGNSISGGTICGTAVSAVTIQGSYIVGGTVQGATLRSVSGSDNGLEICRGVVSSYTKVGGIMFDSGGSGSAEEARDRMFIYTNGGWAMKLFSGGSMSLESVGGIFIAAAGGMTLRAGSKLSIDNPTIVDADDGAWTFRKDGIYRGSVKIAGPAEAAKPKEEGKT